MQTQPFKSQAAVELPGHGDDLSIQNRVAIADCLKAKLLVLPVAPGLGPLVAENRRQVVEPYRLGPVVQAMFQIRSTYRRRSLRPEGQAAAPQVLESVHFFLHNVAAWAHTAHE
jgi:hypothetical protein